MGILTGAVKGQRSLGLVADRDARNERGGPFGDRWKGGCGDKEGIVGMMGMGEMQWPDKTCKWGRRVRTKRYNSTGAVNMCQIALREMKPFGLAEVGFGLRHFVGRMPVVGVFLSWFCDLGLAGR